MIRSGRGRDRTCDRSLVCRARLSAVPACIFKGGRASGPQLSGHCCRLPPGGTADLPSTCRKRSPDRSISKDAEPTAWVQRVTVTPGCAAVSFRSDGLLSQGGPWMALPFPGQPGGASVGRGPGAPHAQVKRRVDDSSRRPRQVPRAQSVSRPRWRRRRPVDGSDRREREVSADRPQLVGRRHQGPGRSARRACRPRHAARRAVGRSRGGEPGIRRASPGGEGRSSFKVSGN